MVNIAEIRALVKAFILSDGQFYPLIILKICIYRIRGIENDGAATVTMRNTAE